MWKPAVTAATADAKAKSATTAAPSGPAHGRKRAPAVTLDELIAQKRARIETARAGAPALLERAATLEASADAMTARYQVRMRRDLRQEAAELRTEARERLSRVREVSFERAARAYLRCERSRQARPSHEVTHHEAPRGSGVGRGRPASIVGGAERAAAAASSTTGDDAVDDDAEDGARRARSPAATTEQLSARIITAPGTASLQTASTYAHKNSAKESMRCTLIQEFSNAIENQPPRLTVRARDDCPFCQTALRLNHVKAIMVCEQCGYAVTFSDSTTSSMSYSDEYEFSSFSYKRVSHFDDTLRQVQGKETYVVPDEIVNQVVRELVAQRVAKHQITQSKIRDVLKKLRLRRAYDNVAQLYTRITGWKSPRISLEQEDACRNLFVRMQPIFDAVCPKGRKNFLSYNYVLFRCFDILGLRYMLGVPSLLRGKEKLQVQDEIFRRIAERLGWPFRPVDELVAEVKRHEAATIARLEGAADARCAAR